MLRILTLFGWPFLLGDPVFAQDAGSLDPLNPMEVGSEDSEVTETAPLPVGTPRGDSTAPIDSTTPTPADTFDSASGISNGGSGSDVPAASSDQPDPAESKNRSRFGSSRGSVMQGRENRLEVYRLKHADPASTERLLRQLLGENSRLTIAYDERLRSLFVSADSDVLKKIEELLKVIDAPVETTPENRLPMGSMMGGGFGRSRGFGGGRGGSSSFGGSRGGSSFGGGRGGSKPATRGGSRSRGASRGGIYPGTDPSAARRHGMESSMEADYVADSSSIAELKAAYKTHNQQAKQLATEMRRTGARSPRGKSRLREAVQKAFEARQNLHRAELAEFTRRMQSLQQSLQSRDRIAGQIVDRRVEELLDPDLDWDAAPDPNAKPAKAPGNPFQEKRPPATSSDFTPAKSPREFFDQLNKHADSIKQLQDSIKRMEAKTAGEGPGPARETVMSLFQQMQREKERLNLLEQDFARQLKMRESQAVKKEAELKLAESEHEFAKRLFQKGYASQRSLEAARLKEQAAKADFEQAQAFVASYKSVWRNHRLLTGGEDAADSADAEMLAIPLKPHVDDSTLSTASSAAELKAIKDEAFGETKNGLRVAVISRLHNAPWDSSHKLLLVVENVSGNIQTISVSGSVPDCDVRRTTQAQLQTAITGRSGTVGRQSITLDPGARAIVASLRVRVTSDFSIKTVPDDADLLIFDANIDRLRNVVYIVKCTKKVISNAKEFPLTTGPFAIAFSRPTDAQTLQGNWNVVGLQGAGEIATPEQMRGMIWSIQGTTITATNPDGSSGKMKFKLNPNTEPKQFDVTTLDGNQKGKSSLGIYELKDGRLRVCFDDEGNRPQDVSDSEKKSRTLITLVKTETITPADNVRSKSEPETRDQSSGEVEVSQGDPPTTAAEKAIARLVLVFAGDKSRRAIPAVLVDGGGETLVIAAAPATSVPDGTPPAIDRFFLELPGRERLVVRYQEGSTKELFLWKIGERISDYRVDKAVELKVGDKLSAMLPQGLEKPFVKKNITRVVALNRKTEWSTPVTNRKFASEGLVQVDRLLPEGTPLFKDGKLAGITLLGNRFLGKNSGLFDISFVVPVSRIAELCNLLERPPMPLRDSSKPVNDVQTELKRIQSLEDSAEGKNKNDRKKILQDAAEAYAEFHQTYREKLAGLYARLPQARCLRKLGEPAKAGEVLRELLKLPRDSEAMRKLHSDVRKEIDRLPSA